MLLELLSVSDLVRRWTFTKEGLRRLMKRDRSFPHHVATVNARRTRLWQLDHIVAYEKPRPWLTDREAKRREQQLRMKRIAGNNRHRRR
jgi:hypothetical protein